MITPIVLAVLIITFIISYKKKGDWWLLIGITGFISFFILAGSWTTALDSGEDRTYVSEDGSSLCIRELVEYDPSYVLYFLDTFERAGRDSVVTCTPLEEINA